MKNLLTLLFIGCFFTFTTSAQVVYNLVPSTTSADNGETITVDFTVENFTDIIGFQYEIGWNSSVLQMQNIITYDNITCNDPSAGSVCWSYPNDFGPLTIDDYFVSNYFDPLLANLSPVNIADGEKLLTIEFLVVGSGGQSSDISFNTQESIIAVKSNFDELSHANGLLTVNNASFNVNGTGCFGFDDVTFTASDESGDTGTTGSIKISVDNFESVESFGYEINWDPTVFAFDSISNINLPDLAYFPSSVGGGNFGSSDADDGILYVSWGEGIPQTVCDGTIIFEIFYTVIGGGGTDTDVEFAGTIEVIKSAGPVPHVTNNGSLNVTGNSNPIIGVGFIAGNASGDNGTQVCVPVTVSSFTNVISFQYELSWDETVMTFDSVVDGAGQAFQVPIQSGNPLGLLDPDPPLFGNFGLTNADDGQIFLAWDNAFGVTLADDTPIFEMCFTIIEQAGASTSIDFGGVTEVVDQSGPVDFTGVSGSVNVTGTFSGLNIGWDCCPEVQAGDSICIDVQVISGFDDLLITTYGLTWDPAVLTFKNFNVGNNPTTNPLGLSIGNNLIGGIVPGEAKVSWFDNSNQGQSLDPGFPMYQVCFDVTSTIGATTTLEIGALPNATPPLAVEIINIFSDDNLPFLGNSCTVTAANIPDLAFTLDGSTNPTCIGDTDGALDISVSGGVLDYTFEWSNGDTTEDISGLGAGNYTVTVTDCNGMTATQTYTLSDPSPITITATITDESGFGNDGEISLNVTGGTGNYTTYSWSTNTNSTSSVASGLSTDTYDVTVTDSDGCQGTATFEVGEICGTTTITITANITDVSGAGNDGAIDLTLNGGATPYTSFAWSSNANGQTSQNISGLAQGTYTVTATDANGCQAINTFSVGTACTTFSVTGTVTNETSAGNDGAINVQPTGLGYSYAWTPNVGNTSNPSGLASGVYTVTVTDQNSCTSSASFTVEAFNCPAVSVSGSGSHVTCQGGNDGTASASASGGNGNFTYNWGAAGTGQNINGLAAGTYTVTATDTDGCFSTATVTVNDGISIGVTILSTQDLSCFNNNSGAIFVQGTGGSGAYTYNWSAGNSTSGTNAGLAAGTYSVTATNVATGCTGSIGGIIISQPADISITGTVSDVDCNGGNNGSIALNILGGTGGYSVAWSNGGSGQTLNNLTAGTYTPTITDANGCVKTGPTFTIGQPLALNVNPTINDASCFGDCDGTASVSVSGGTAPYTINWSNGQVGPTATGLCAGVITVGITDANGCTFSDTYTIGQPVAFTLDFSVTNESTAGTDGAISLTVSPSGAYSFLWTAANQSTTWTSQNLNNLIADVYTVVVTNTATGCTQTGVTAVTNSLGIQSEMVTDVTCFEGNDGSIDIEISGGEEPYSYLWDGPTGNPSTQDLSNLVSGTYSVTITDADGTQLFASYTVDQPAPLVITSVFITNEIDDCDGAINIEVAGGMPPYTYQWNTGEDFEDPFDLCEGDYHVTIIDSKGCFIVSPNYVVEESLPQSGSVATTGVSCAGGSDGTLTVNIVGGNLPYTVCLLDNTGAIITQQTSQASSVGFGALASGQYTTKITDANGNIVNGSPIFIPEPSPLQISGVVTDQSATVCNGSIDITVTGGTQPYNYQWNNGPTQPDQFNLCMGNYDVTVTDANGCVLVSPTYVVNKELELSQIVTPVSCFGESNGSIDFSVAGGIPPYVYSWVDANNVEIATTEDLTNIPAGTYGVMVTDDNGNGTQLFSGMLTVTQPDLLEITNTFVIAPSITDCSDGEISLTVTGGTPYPGNPQYDFYWEDANGNPINGDDEISNLTGGLYYVTISDANGCETEAEVALQGCEIVPSISQEDITCFGENNGSASATATNGTSPWTYEWSTGETGNTISNLSAGDYTVTITDANGIEGIETIIIAEPSPLEVIVTTTPGRAEAVVIGGTAPYTYQWSSQNAPSSEAFIDGLNGGSEYVLVVTDANGCVSVMQEFRVAYDGDCLIAREVISPNEDSFNDVFYVNCVEDQPVKVTIFNRWGEEVFQSDEYDNSWAGTGKRGELLPEGGYMYVLEVEAANGGIQIIKGSLSLVR